MPSNIGTVLPYGKGSSPPTNWLMCDGAAVSRTTYSILFALVGTTFGVGDGSTTFNVPDMSGRVPIGSGQGGGLTNRNVGDNGGEEDHVVLEAELASHVHSLKGSVSIASYDLGPSRPIPYTSNSNGPATASTGSDTAHENMMPFLSTGFIIKAL